MKIINTILILFGVCLLASGATPLLMKQQDLCTFWVKNNPNYKVEFSADKCTATCLKNERKALAIQSRNITTLKPGVQYLVTFQARGTTNSLDFIPQFNGKRDSTQLKNYKITDSWQTYQTTLKVPEGCKRFSCAIYAWNQKGFFEIKDFSITLNETSTNGVGNEK
jgi:hypothetical protein